MREILVAVVIRTGSGISRKLIGEMVREGIEPLWFMDGGSVGPVHLLEADMPQDDKEEISQQLTGFTESVGC